MKLKKALNILIVATFLGAGSAAYGDIEEFVAAFTKANETRKQARGLNHEWRDTAKLLKSAREAAESGDMEKAMSLVVEAQLQGEQAIIQAVRESQLWEGRVIR